MSVKIGLCQLVEIFRFDWCGDRYLGQLVAIRHVAGNAFVSGQNQRARKTVAGTGRVTMRIEGHPVSGIVEGLRPLACIRQAEGAKIAEIVCPQPWTVGARRARRSKRGDRNGKAHGQNTHQALLQR